MRSYPDAIVRAAGWWQNELAQGRHEAHLWGYLNAKAGLTLTQTQYQMGLSLFRKFEAEMRGRWLGALPATASAVVFLEYLLEDAGWPWLSTADEHVREVADMPYDMRRLATALDVSPTDAFDGLQRVHQRVDLAQRKAIGNAGERALVAELETRWPGSTTHVALFDDRYGYDVVFEREGIAWHLEIKSTVKRHRLKIYVSRHEHNVALRDDDWRMVIVGLDAGHQLAAVATVPYESLARFAPKEQTDTSRWENLSYVIDPRILRQGFAPAGISGPMNSGFAWMPDSSL